MNPIVVGTEGVMMRKQPRLHLLLGSMVLLWLAVACTGCSCGAEDPKQPPTKVEVPKPECRLDGDCSFPKQCVNDVCTVLPVRPTIRLVLPEKGESSSEVQLQVLGQHFEKGAKVQWDGSFLKTTYKSETELLAIVSGVTDEKSHEVNVIHLDGLKSRGYLLALKQEAQVDRISASQVRSGCGKETIVVWGRYFWKELSAKLVAKKGSAEFPASEVLFRPNGEVHLQFDFSEVPKGSYDLVLHNGDKSKSVTRPFEVQDKLPTPQILSWGPHRFWWGSKAQVYLVGLNLQHADIRFQQQPTRVFAINQSTFYVEIDLNELPRQKEVSHFWLTMRPLCQSEQKFFPIEVHDIPKPTIKSFSPQVVRFSHEDDVTVLGEGFHPDARLWINGKEVLEATRQNLTTFRIPRSLLAEPGDYSIQVRNSQFFRSAEVKLKVDHTPIVNSLSPSLLKKNREEKITIEGDNFGPQVQVRVGEDLVDGVERISATRLLIPSNAFDSAKTYQVIVVNPGSPAYASKPFSFEVKEGPQIATLSSPLLLLDHTQKEVQIVGSDFDEQGSLLVDGKVVSNTYAQWVNEQAWNIAVGFFEKTGEYTFQIQNQDNTLSNKVTLFVRNKETKVLSEVKEIGELTYLCGEGLRNDELPLLPRIVFRQVGETKAMVEVEASNSTFDTNCLYFNTKEIEFLEPKTYLVLICQDEEKGTVCSNEFPWVWRGATSTTTPQEFPPEVQWIRPIQPTTFVWEKDKQPETFSVMIGGKHFRGDTKVMIDGQDISSMRGARLAVLSDRIVLYDLPLPSKVYGTHVVEVMNKYGKANTFSFTITEKESLRILWTPQVFIPRDDSFNFQLYGSHLSRSVLFFLDDANVKVGSATLPWSQFASTPPYFISSFDWTESSKLKVGLRKVQVKTKSGAVSNPLWMVAGNDDLWGKEPLTLQAVDDIYRYTNSAGLAPYPNQTVSLRMAYTGFTVSSGNAKTNGQILVDNVVRTYTTGLTSLFGFSFVQPRAFRVTGSPRVVPIVLRNPDNTASNYDFLTVMPHGSYRITKVYNAIDFTSIVRPDQAVQLQIHGNFLSQDDTFYFLGRKVKVSTHFRDPDTKDEFVRITINAGDLPNGRYPLWAVNPRANVSNSLMITVRDDGIGGAPRWRSINPMVLSKSALSSAKAKARLVIHAVGLTKETVLKVGEKSYPIQRFGAEMAYVELDLDKVEPGAMDVALHNPKASATSTMLRIVIEP
ncbi:MAG: hypothetical protein EP343_28405 [Deltaproteobacteria bacterium]|nr:MAG: hypothetical protein EP343_28405 [Deltaproteobacteria bacterium]